MGGGDDPPAQRRPEIEGALCEAIAKLLLVEFRYKDDMAFRLFAPYAVYHSPKDKVLVTGTQIDNPGDPLDRYVPRNFEVGLIRDLNVTSTNFQPDPRFNRFDPKFEHGVICAIQRV
jgi:hypothetical protein